MIMNRCSGCGIILQTENEQALGFVKSMDHDLCLDCFNLKHYSKVINQNVIKGDVPIVSEDALIIYVLSINHLSLRLKYRLDRHFPNSKYILVLNHIDTLEKSVHLGRMIHKIKAEAAQLNMRFDDIIPVSALQDYNVDILIESMKYHQHKKNIYLIGFQNSGKSLLYRRIAEHLNQETPVLSGKKPGLTQHNFELPFNHKKLIDTPGIFLEGSIASFIPYEAYKHLTIEARIKPRNFQLNPLQSVYIGGIAAFSYLDGPMRGITFYAAAKTNLHRTKFDETYAKFIEKKGTLFSPTSDEPYVKHTFVVKDDLKYEIMIAEICFIHFEGKGKFEIFAPKGLRILLTEALY